jgi:hypothetical protein
MILLADVLIISFVMQIIKGTKVFISGPLTESRRTQLIDGWISSLRGYT